VENISQFWHGVIFVNAYDADDMGFLSAERFLLGRGGADEDAVVVDARAGFVRDDAGYSAFGFFDCFADASGAGLVGQSLSLDLAYGLWVGVVDYLHWVVTGSDQIRWKPSRWARSSGSSLRRAVSIAEYCLRLRLCRVALDRLEREDQ
jgi:hypothetical protein